LRQQEKQLERSQTELDAETERFINGNGSLYKVQAAAFKVELGTRDVRQQVETDALRKAIQRTVKEKKLQAKKIKQVVNGVKALVEQMNGTKKEAEEARGEAKALQSNAEKERVKAELKDDIRTGVAKFDYETGKVKLKNGDSVDLDKVKAALTGKGTTPTKGTTKGGFKSKVGVLRTAADGGRGTGGRGNTSSVASAAIVAETLGGGQSRHRHDRDTDLEMLELTGLMDPAKMHSDSELMQDLIVLISAAALGGVVASLLLLPSSIGSVIFGVIVGPSGIALVSPRGVAQVETLAQLGSVFLLFLHGKDLLLHKSLVER
jgi:hypothetical protein